MSTTLRAHRGARDRLAPASTRFLTPTAR